MKEFCYSLEEIDGVVEQLHALMSKSTVLTFTGPLGAGKTTLVKRLLARCGVDELVTSPTFTYVSHYHNKQGEEFYHFDLYRLTTIDEFIQAGFAEQLYLPRSWVCIEWPEIIMPLLTHAVTHVTIDYAGYKRCISWETLL